MTDEKKIEPLPEEPTIDDDEEYPVVEEVLRDYSARLRRVAEDYRATIERLTTKRETP